MRVLRAPGRVSSRLAMVGLASVLVLLAGFTVWTAVRGNRQADRYRPAPVGSVAAPGRVGASGAAAPLGATRPNASSFIGRTSAAPT
jgi:hypothetical protein